MTDVFRNLSSLSLTGKKVWLRGGELENKLVAMLASLRTLNT